jgi:hypothetical protein
MLGINRVSAVAMKRAGSAAVETGPPLIQSRLHHGM